jgi:hypothetical protein
MPRRGLSLRLKMWLAIFLIFLAAIYAAWRVMVWMPGRSFRGPLPPLTPEEATLRDELAAHVHKLGGEIGERNIVRYAQLAAAADYIEQSFSAAGLRVRRDRYTAWGKECDNLEAEIRGMKAPEEIVVIGGHYDSVIGAPGANDNGSGTAAVLALARRFAGKPGTRTLRFVAFVNEEPPGFQRPEMGSWVYASRCRERGERIVAMVSLETIGCFSNEPDSQSYPLPALGLIYPTEGNFISFVGNVQSRQLVRQAIGSFRRHGQFPSQGAALPAPVPGVGWSDHWAFWQHGYPGIMVTDTAPFRYPHYHTPTDTPEQVDYEAMSRVVHALESVVAELANGSG